MTASIRTPHELRLTLTEGGITATVVCLGDPADTTRDCTFYAASVYPCTLDERCFVADTCNEVNLDEMLGQFEAFDLPPVAIGWAIERETGGDWAAIHPEQSGSDRDGAA